MEATASVPTKSWFQRVPGPVWGLIALGVGMTLGSLYPQQLFPVGNGVKVAFSFLADAAPYIIFFTLTPAIGDMLKTGSAAKFAGAVTLAYVCTTLVAGFWAVVVLVPLFGLEFGVGDSSLMAALASVGRDTFALATTSELFIAIWWSVICGLGLHWGRKAGPTEWFARPTADVLRRVGVDGVERLGGVLKTIFPLVLFTIGVYIPTGAKRALDDGLAKIEASGANPTDVSGAGWFGDIAGTSAVAWYFVAVGVAVFVLLAFLAFFGTIVSLYTKTPLKTFFRDYVLYVYPFAWATSSSAASIPINLDATKRLGVRKEVREFIVPLGATVNLDGTMMVAFVLTVIAGILTGYKPTVLDLVILILPLTVVTIGTPGIPAGIAFVAPPVIANFLPLEAAVVPAFMAIWAGFSVGLSDQFRTGVNTCDNGLLSMLFEHWYPKHFERPAAVSVPVGGADAPSLEAPEAPAPLDLPAEEPGKPPRAP